MTAATDTSEVVNSSLLLLLLPWWYPYRRKGQPVYHGNPEALGFALDSVGRSVGFIGAAGFLGTALLKLAKEEAGCETEPSPETGKVPECEGRVYGIRPSSLLTTYTIVVGIVSAALLPLMGAIVDYTENRRLVARVTSVTICVLMFPQMFVNEDTWIAVAFLQIAVAFAGWAQTMVSHAYLPELTNVEERLNAYTKSFTVVTFTSMVLYLAGVIGMAYLLGLGDVGTAQLGIAVGLVLMAVLLYLAWGHLFQTRPPARELPNGQSLWSAGFIQIYHTSQHIHRNLPTLRWFYIAVAFLDAGIKYVVGSTTVLRCERIHAHF